MRKGNMLDVATLVKSTMIAPRIEQEKRIPRRADRNFSQGKGILPFAPAVIRRRPAMEKSPRIMIMARMFRKNPANFPRI